MRDRVRSLLLRYGLSLATILLAVGLRLALDPALGEHYPFVTFLVPVILIAWYAGFGASLVSIVTALLLADFFFLQPRYSLWIHQPADHLGFALYAVAGTVMMLLARGVRGAYLRLEASEKAAEAASQAKGRFLANVSHELRTPMSVVLGMTDLALEEELAPVARDYVQTANDSAAALLALLNDLLDSARIESGNFSLELAPFRVRDVLGEAQKTFTMQAGEKGLELICEVADDVPEVLLGDAVRLRQILVNLVGNAITFTDHGHVEIRIRVESQADAEVWLRFTVEDTGIGIPPEQQQRIFCPFVQAESAPARRQGGTGLGLAIVVSLVEKMYGRIWVESQPGCGSAFHFTAAFMRPTEAAYPEPEPVRQGLSRECPSRQLRILLAEDTPANQKLVAHVLQKRGHVVEVVSNGRDAIDRVRQEDFHVVLMDVQMPVMDGWQATTAIRALVEPDKARVPIVAMTAHAMRGDRQHCLAHGMDAYLAKPIRGRDLVDLVERIAADVPETRQQSEDGSGAVSERIPPAAREPNASPTVQRPDPQDGLVVFNRGEALNRCFGNDKLFHQMVDCFYGEADTLLADMRTALDAGNTAEVGRLAHRLRGTVVYLGAQAAAQAAQHVEQLARSGATSGITRAIGQTEEQLQRLKCALAVGPEGDVKPVSAPHNLRGLAG